MYLARGVKKSDSARLAPVSNRIIFTPNATLENVQSTIARTEISGQVNRPVVVYRFNPETKQAEFKRFDSETKQLSQESLSSADLTADMVLVLPQQEKIILDPAKQETRTMVQALALNEFKQVLEQSQFAKFGARATGPITHVFDIQSVMTQVKRVQVQNQVDTYNATIRKHGSANQSSGCGPSG